MRSPRKPGYSPLWPDPPSWVDAPSDPLIFEHASSKGGDLVIADMHFADFDTMPINVRNYTRLIVERCTFARIDSFDPDHVGGVGAHHGAIYPELVDEVIVRDCAFWNCTSLVQLNKCGSGLIEDCWGVNVLGEWDNVGDIVNLYHTDNGVIRRCKFMGGGIWQNGAGIIVGDGAEIANTGGDKHLVQDCVLIDCNIAANGTNERVRRNTVLNRGLVPGRDGMHAGIYAKRADGYPVNVAGPWTVQDNDVCWYRSNGSRAGTVYYDPATPPTGLLTNPVNPLIDEYSVWDVSGYYGAE